MDGFLQHEVAAIALTESRIKILNSSNLKNSRCEMEGNLSMMFKGNLSRNLIIRL